MNPPQPDYLGTLQPRLVLYLPHRPNGMEQLVTRPSARVLVSLNSNHWRKIVTLLAKIASPEADDWRDFRDEALFDHTALCFEPVLKHTPAWHWIGGKENQQRFAGLNPQIQSPSAAPEISVDPAIPLLLTPYPDYRQLSNRIVSTIRQVLREQGFYTD